MSLFDRSIMAIPFVPENLGPSLVRMSRAWFRISDYQAPRGVSNGASLYLFHAWKISTEYGEKDSVVLLSSCINLLGPLRINFPFNKVSKEIKINQLLLNNTPSVCN